MRLRNAGCHDLQYVSFLQGLPGPFTHLLASGDCERLSRQAEPDTGHARTQTQGRERGKKGRRWQMQRRRSKGGFADPCVVEQLERPEDTGRGGRGPITSVGSSWGTSRHSGRAGGWGGLLAPPVGRKPWEPGSSVEFVRLLPPISVFFGSEQPPPSQGGDNARSRPLGHGEGRQEIPGA